MITNKSNLVTDNQIRLLSNKNLKPKQYDLEERTLHFTREIIKFLKNVPKNFANNEILKAYPDLQQEDITQALRYAAEAVRERELPLVNGA